ncbi:MAG: hypothetical protein IPL26_13125 [Leptospiraceae bacterium]|nr:hypothetical protein [Leptospiraceae bacterium]MBK8396165.1 hypothetical protein [Leptospiraceae bacterium]
MEQIKFSEIEVGTPVLFNGHYARKTKVNEIHVPRLGVDGFFEIMPDDFITIYDSELYEN